MPFLYEHQQKALDRLKNGNILCGGTGSGKSRTALAYYYKQSGGKFIDDSDAELPFTLLDSTPKDLYIITTAKKRDQLEWDKELSDFWLGTTEKSNHYSNTIVVDSWNNIAKYKDIKDSFFIFDEQRVVGSGTWVKSFIAISKFNEWILLSATPGDTWSDYIPVFVANGYFKNKTEFNREHVVFNSYVSYPLIDRYYGTDKLNYFRHKILIPMDFHRSTVQDHKTIYLPYDELKYKTVIKKRWNVFTDEPIKNASEYCYTLRKVVNTCEDRAQAVLDILSAHPKVIIFYNFDYELEALRAIPYAEGTLVTEWNGHKHEQIPDNEPWVYLVQYTAGSEGWNCVDTDTIIFYTPNYSFKVLTQASGRIDRMNTHYTHLNYYHLQTRAGIDIAISKTVVMKKKFNEQKFSPKFE